MYLEVSNIAAAINKNPYEPTELIYLILWARNDPKSLLKYLVDNDLIVNHKIEEEEVDDEMTLAYENVIKNIDKKNFSTNDFTSTSNKIIEEYKKIRPNFKSDEIKKLETNIKSQIIKENGNIQETNIINNKKYQKGNNKMWYYHIGDHLIGGKHDANENNLVIEIKSRTNIKNVKKNEYDLCQLIGYLLCMNEKRGKIVQNFNKQIFDSNIENNKEYGIIDLNENRWNNYKDEMINKLEIFFEECENCIFNKKINLDKIYKFGKIADITIDGRLININNKYKKICDIINHSDLQ
jgi:hypothetical protein